MNKPPMSRACFLAFLSVSVFVVSCKQEHRNAAPEDVTAQREENKVEKSEVEEFKKLLEERKEGTEISAENLGRFMDLIRTDGDVRKYIANGYTGFTNIQQGDIMLNISNLSQDHQFKEFEGLLVNVLSQEKDRWQITAVKIVQYYDIPQKQKLLQSVLRRPIRGSAYLFVETLKVYMKTYGADTIEKELDSALSDGLSEKRRFEVAAVVAAYGEKKHADKGVMVICELLDSGFDAKKPKTVASMFFEFSEAQIKNDELITRARQFATDGKGILKTAATQYLDSVKP